MSTLFLCFSLIFNSCLGKIYFYENFDGEYLQRWTIPKKWKSESELGKWAQTKGKWSVDEKNFGLQTTERSKFYGLIAKLDEPFTQTGDLVLQFAVKNENVIECAGAYIKLLGDDVDMESFGGDTKYQIMFGPDICGSSKKITHVIFNYNDKNLENKSKIKVENDQLTHIYTLHVMKDGTYEVYIDLISVKKGNLEKDYDFFGPKMIPDPNVTKPLDWVDEKFIPDPEAVKPEGYDDIPREVPDPDAEKPEEWDEDEEGEWEPPRIANPAYLGPWKAPMIKNPEYKGEWIHPQISNPDYKEDPNLFKRCNNCTHIGIEIWQVTSGTIFDDIMVTDSLEEAQEVVEKGWASWKDLEKEKFNELKEAENLKTDKNLEGVEEEYSKDWAHEEL